MMPNLQASVSRALGALLLKASNFAGCSRLNQSAGKTHLRLYVRIS